MNLYLFNYNNYYNRIIKRHNELSEYIEDGESELRATIAGVAFNPNDGVSTRQIVNYISSDGKMPDYCVVVDEDTSVIDSRWFIIESKRERIGQYNLTLYRDMISDWYDSIVNAPMYIEKATVNLNDPAIFNNESLTFNQIKTSEFKIKDKSNSAWIVGYVKKNTPALEINIPQTDLPISGEFSTKTEYEFNNYETNGLIGGEPTDPTIMLYTYFTREPLFQDTINTPTAVGWDQDGRWKTPSNGQAIDGIPGAAFYPTGTQENPNPGYRCVDDELAPRIPLNWLLQTDWESNLNAAINLSDNQNTVSRLINENGKYYNIGGKIYQIVVNSEVVRTKRNLTSYTDYGKKITRLANALIDAGKLGALNPTSAGIVGGIEYSAISYTITYVQMDTNAITTTLLGPKSQLDDAPYDMFAMPWTVDNIPIALKKDGVTYYADNNLTSQVLSYILVGLSSALIDVQLLPYCPLEDYQIEADSTYSIINAATLGGETSRCDIINGSSSTFVIYPIQSRFDKRIKKPNYVIEIPTDSIEFKVANECDLYRLVSPNYNGEFQFSPTKNNGVSAWNVSIYYKPFMPYIRVSPEFGRLYGKDFHDSRGLICGGDFSITQIESEWTNYELNNKNYQVMFDRQIQNMEVNNSIQRKLEKVDWIMGSIEGAISGANAGSSAGPWGAAAGAYIGFGSSAIAGSADIAFNDALRREALDYTIDQFNYSLQNIQARPYSITKVGAQNLDNKIFPFVEYYTCTDIEKNALRNKINYNGMTVMRIDKMINFIQEERSYIKGKLIRLEDIAEEYHLVNSIAKELNQGVFI